MCVCEHFHEFLSLSLFLSFSSSPFCLHLLIQIITPLHCVATVDLVSHRGSCGFSPSWSPGDASTSYLLAGQQEAEAACPFLQKQGNSLTPGHCWRSFVPKLAHRSGRRCWGLGGPPAAWSPGTRTFDWLLRNPLRCEDLIGQEHQRVDWRWRRALKVQLLTWCPVMFGWIHAP